ncbi:MAG: transcription initiation factor IIB family protein [Nitrososphaerota archaeon]
MEYCPQCGSSSLVQDEEGGEIVCSNCGLVISHRIPDRRPEWKHYSFTKDDRERVGDPLTFLIHDMGLSTTTLEYDLHSYSISRILKKNIVESGDKSLMKTLSAIHSLSSKMHLPESVEENAALIVRRLWKKGLRLGRNCKGLAAASLYVSSKMFSMPRNMREFIINSGISRKTFWDSYKKIIQDTGIKKDPRTIDIMISKIVNQSNLKGEVENLANKIVEMARDMKIVDGRKPDGLAAAAVYLAAKKLGHRVNQRKLAKIAAISLVTLRSRCRELESIINKLQDSF